MGTLQSVTSPLEPTYCGYSTPSRTGSGTAERLPRGSRGTTEILLIQAVTLYVFLFSSSLKDRAENHRFDQGWKSRESRRAGSSGKVLRGCFAWAELELIAELESGIISAHPCINRGRFLRKKGQSTTRLIRSWLSKDSLLTIKPNTGRAYSDSTSHYPDWLDALNMATLVPNAETSTLARQISWDVTSSLNTRPQCP